MNAHNWHLTKKMELKELPGLIILITVIGMLIGIGILVFGKFGDASYDSKVVENESFTMPAKETNVTLAHGNITSFSKIINASGQTLPGANYTVFKTEGNIENNNANSTCYNGMTCYAWYTFKDYDTATRTAMIDVSDETGIIASTWLSLIVTVIMLSFVLVIVIRSFANRG